LPIIEVRTAWLSDDNRRSTVILRGGGGGWCDELSSLACSSRDAIFELTPGVARAACALVPLPLLLLLPVIETAGSALLLLLVGLRLLME